ncbi:MAG: hypothetical protein GX102_06520 [Porphyromonadaceae bacterium]|nr:hypothetical protein [Porphyromonadaceae bacterium]
MQTYFKYYLNNGSKKSYYIRNELDHSRPVYVEINGDPVAHAVVVDGYDSDGRFHIDFGWGGSENGYFMLNNNSSFYASYSFSSNIRDAFFLSKEPIYTNQQDSVALVAVHNALNQSTGWDLSTPVATWNGVLIMNGRVVELFLNKNPESPYNGRIAPEIGNLTELQSLVLDGKLEGEIPTALFNLTKLRELSIRDNNGTFKAVLSENIGNLTDLEILVVPGKCEGTIPVSFGNLRNLQRIDLSGGKLTGNIPAGIGNLTKLVTLKLDNNQLSGSLPASIGSLENLWDLQINDNQLSGEIPATFGNLINLEYLSLYNNRFTGALPASFGNLVKLNRLDFSNNQFEKLPESIGNLKNVVFIDVRNNRLTELPNSISDMDKLLSLDASNNRLETQPGFGGNESLKWLNLSYNRLQSISPAIFQLAELEKADFSHNFITKLPAGIEFVSDKMTVLKLNNNEINSPIPRPLLLKPNLTTLLDQGMDLSQNRFTFDNIPDADTVFCQVGFQKPVKLKKHVFKAQIGDTLRINVQDLADLSKASNVYHWAPYHKDAYSVEYFTKYNSTIGGWPPFPDVTGPILTVVVDENTHAKQFLCYITDLESPYIKKDDMIEATQQWAFYSGEYVYTYKPFLCTDTIRIEIADEAGVFADAHPDKRALLSKNIPADGVTDHSVTLSLPATVYGETQWQSSIDGVTWFDVSENTASPEIKANVQSIHGTTVKLVPQHTAQYRCKISNVNCEPMYSDTVRVTAFGSIIYDQIVRKNDTTATVITTDSIDVIIPHGFHDEDFRLTIVKVDNPPKGKNAPPFTLGGGVYDVSVSFGNEFDRPLLIKLKNINTSGFTKQKIDNYRAVFFNEKTEKWEEFEDYRFSLVDSTLCFSTRHLTKVSFFSIAGMGYSDYHTKDGITVYYNETDFASEIPYKQTPQPWHESGVPVLVADAAHYLKEVITAYKRDYPDTPDEFTIYLKPLGESEGEVSLMGTFGGYMMVNVQTKTPEQLCKTMSHELMHYIQDDVMLFISNDFWMEAHATLADRVVWGKDFIPISESEQWFAVGLNGQIFDNLAVSWDHFASNKPSPYAGRSAYYLGGCFMHYMQDCREGAKLNPLKLLYQTMRSPRDMLSSYAITELNSTLGKEYENFLLYLLSGKNDNFSLLTGRKTLQNAMLAVENKSVTSGNKESAFTTIKDYKMELSDNPITETVKLSIPSLASRMVIFRNSSKDVVNLVKIKRNHNPDYRQAVYYAQFNQTENEFTFTNITDSTTFSFLLDVQIHGEGSMQKNISFLLFINKESKSINPFNFDASYDVTVSPILNFSSIGALNILTDEAPEGSSGSAPYTLFAMDGITNKMWDELYPDVVPGIKDYTVTRESVRKELIEGKIMVSKTNYTREYTTWTWDGPESVYSIRQFYSVQQQVEYNLETGAMKITNHSLTKRKDSRAADFSIVKDDKDVVKLREIRTSDFTKTETEGLYNYQTPGQDATRHAIESIQRNDATLRINYGTSNTLRLVMLINEN